MTEENTTSRVLPRRQATELRTCKKCNEEKPLTDYYKCSKTAWRRSCKVCCNKNHKKWRDNNKDVVAGYVEKWVENNRDKWNEYSRTYRRENYDPVKRHEIYMKHTYGENQPILTK